MKSVLTAQATGTAIADSRYVFTFQFLQASDFFSNKAAHLEVSAITHTESERARHRAFVVGAIMQAVAALEAEVHEITHQGPGSYLGSNDSTREGQLKLAPFRDEIDKLKGLPNRFDEILRVLGKAWPSEKSKLRDDAGILVALRNRLVHYKSVTGQKMDQQAFFTQLQALNLPSPPWATPTNNFFPHHALSSGCARWATETAISYLKQVYSLLELPTYLERFGCRLT
jgi:hypothetical protein